MKVKVKYNLLKDVPDCITLESTDVDEICRQMRALFDQTDRRMVVAETEGNILWINEDDRSRTIAIGERAPDNVIGSSNWIANED
jgi:hypothetical protein